MKVFENFSLKAYNTFGIDVKARKFISVTSIDDLKTVLKQTYSDQLFILGGGSNMLLTKDIDATVVHLDLKGIEITRETEEYVLIRAEAGENWHQFVLHTLENNWGGLENLSLIPGNIGTAPIQNIGAYGVELKDTFYSCTALNIQTLEVREFSLEECGFGYRNSIFKNDVKGKYVITSVTFKLKKKDHLIQTNYGAIDTALEEMGIDNPTIQDVSKAVIKIRQEKLPDPKILGNSGSFFKNPVISAQEFDTLKLKFPKMPSYQISDNEVKIPAGWLIDTAGLKGFREGDAGIHINQALVLVNYGNATGSEIWSLAAKVQEKVYDLFNIKLEAEVNVF